MSQILVAHALDAIFDNNILNKMFRFRCKVFYERLGWDVGNENGMERDFYDELNPVYMVAQNYRNEIEACTRLLPTTGPYMLKDTFPQLLGDETAPQDPIIWEMSRFAVLPSDCGAPIQAVLSPLTYDMLRSFYDFGQQHGIQRYILVTSASVERLLTRAGLPLYRFGNRKAQRIGKTLSVVCWLDVSEKYRQFVYENCTSIQQDRVAA